MKTKHIKTIVLALLGVVALSAGCEKEIPFDAEVKQPKIVVNSLFQPDSLWAVRVGYSLSVIDNNYPGPLDSAVVEIFDAAGTRVDSLEFDGMETYLTTRNLKPNAGETYQIRASRQRYASVTSNSYCPAPVSIVSWDTTKVSNPDNGDQMEITVTIADNPNEDNFYALAMPVTSTTIYGTDTIINSYTIGMTSSDPIVEQPLETEPGSTPYFTVLMFTDQFFSGQSYTLKFSVDYYIFENQWTDFRVDLSLYSCTEAFFRYLISYDAYQNTYGNPFAQPVQVYSNIDGGFGIFAGASTFKTNLKP